MLTRIGIPLLLIRNLNLLIMDAKEKVKRRSDEVEKMVTQVLIETPITRDDDRLLIWFIWRMQYPRLDKYTLEMFRSAFLGGILIPPESITRARRKVQEVRLDLRGLEFGNRYNLQNVYRRYFGVDAFQQSLFSGHYRDMAVAAEAYAKISQSDDEKVD